MAAENWESWSVALKQFPQLQRSRSRMAAENARPPRVTSTAPADFNGAAAGWPRKTTAARLTLARAFCTSTEPQPDGRGKQSGEQVLSPAWFTQSDARGSMANHAPSRGQP